MNPIPGNQVLNAQYDFSFENQNTSASERHKKISSISHQLILLKTTYCGFISRDNMAQLLAQGVSQKKLKSIQNRTCRLVGGVGGQSHSNHTAGSGVLSGASSSIPNTVDLHPILFPGKDAKFVLTNGDWERYKPSGDYQLNRYLNFTSQTRDSFFKEVSLYGYISGYGCIKIKFDKNDAVAINYLLKCEIELSDVNKAIGSYRSNKFTTPLLFKILMMHNEFPAKYISLMRYAIALQSLG